MAVHYKIANHTNINIMNIFLELGENIRREWAKHHYTEDALVETAGEMLNKAALHQKLHAADLIDYAMYPNPLIAAHQIDSPFGDLQQIMYSHSKFYIEALYWCDGTTAVHDHGFSGAFYVMSGSSINVQYQFDVEERVNHHFSFGHLSNPIVNKLTPGSVQPIYSGKRFIHSVFHLDNPTVSIVVRTYQDDDAMPQFDYRGNKIRLVEKLLPEFSKKIQALKFILQSHSEKFCRLFKEVYMESPSDERYWLIRAFYSNLILLPSLWQFLNELEDPKTHIILEAVADEVILHKTILLRNNIDHQETRFFLALLLNSPTWNDLLRFIDTYAVDSHLFVERALNHCKSMGLAIPNKNLDIHHYKKEPITSANALYHLISKRLLIKS